MSRPSHLTTYTDEQYAEMINRVRINRAAKIAAKTSNLSFVPVVNSEHFCEVCQKIKKENIETKTVG